MGPAHEALCAVQQLQEKVLRNISEQAAAALAHCDRCGKGVGLPFQQGFRCVVDQQGGLIDISLLPEHRKARCLAFASIGSEAHLDLGSRIAHREAL